MEINSIPLIIFLSSLLINFTNVNTLNTINSESSTLDDFYKEIAKQMHDAFWMISSKIDYFKKEVETNAKITSRDLFDKFDKLKTSFRDLEVETQKDAFKKEIFKPCINNTEKYISEKFNAIENKTKVCIQHAMNSALEVIDKAEKIFFEAAHNIFQRANIFFMEVKTCNLTKQLQCIEKNKNLLIQMVNTLTKKSLDQVQEIQRVANTKNLEQCKSFYKETLEMKTINDKNMGKTCYLNSISKETRYRRSLPNSKLEEKKIEYYKEKYKEKLVKYSKEIDKEYQSGVNQLKENKNELTNNLSNQIKETKIYMESAKENSINGIKNEWQKQQFSKCMENYEASLKFNFVQNVQSRASYCFTNETENGVKNMEATKKSYEDSAVNAVYKAKKNCKNKSKSCYSKRKIFEETCKNKSEDMKKNIKIQKTKMENCYNKYSQNLKEARMTYQYLLEYCFQFISSNVY